MRFHELRVSPTPGTGYVEGDHPWRLPNRIGCPACGVYGAIGASHPTIDLSGFPEADTLSRDQGVSWREYSRQADALSAFLGDGPLLGPGDSFGRFEGRLVGKPAAFMEGDIELLFASAEALHALEGGGVAIPPSAPARLRRGRKEVEMLELDLPRAGGFADESYPFLAHRCSVCGRMDGGLERMVLAEESLPESLDLFRPANHPTIIIASERFRDAAERLSLPELRFEPVEVSGRS